MTNEQAKQEAIKLAFGDKWDLFTEEYKQHLLERKHWVDVSVKYGAMVAPNYSKKPTPQIMDFNGEIEEKCEFWRPKSLSGIEDNNGWTRIEPDGSNLPTDENETYKCYSLITKKTSQPVGCKLLKDWIKNDKEITHYKPIEKELLPIY